MDILHYFKAVDFEAISQGKEYADNQLGALLKINEGSELEWDGVKLAIIGVSEERGALNNEGTAMASDQFRSFFYQLRMEGGIHHQIADLGNVLAGDKVSDTYFAIKEVVAELIKSNILPIIIGGGQDLTYANYLAYSNLEQTINLVAIDAAFGLGDTDAITNSQNYLSKIILHQPNNLFNFSNIGYQSYFIGQQELTLLSELYFDVYRLGFVKADIRETEPIIRNADFLSFDLGAIQQSDAPANNNATPNGLSGAEACQLARYAGMSDKLTSVGFYELNPTINDRGQSAHLLAQMVWYFIEGFYQRKLDFPACNKSEYTKYTVATENSEEDLIFYKSDKSDRWWMDVPYSNRRRSRYERHLMVPCSYRDYQQATENEMPERWFQTFKKLK